MTGPYHPIVAIPTTAGTGSEVVRSSVITSRGLGRKIIIFSPWLMPKCAILDPELTLGLPAHVTAATGIDAMVHAIEAYTSRHKKNPMSDQLARQALALLSTNLSSEVALRVASASSELRIACELSDGRSRL